MLSSLLLTTGVLLSFGCKRFSASPCLRFKRGSCFVEQSKGCCLLEEESERSSAAWAVLQAITIQSSGGLTQAEIDRMVRDAEEFAVRDQERRKVTEAKNEADSLVYSSEKAVDEHRANLPTVRVPPNRYRMLAAHYHPFVEWAEQGRYRTDGARRRGVCRER